MRVSRAALAATLLGLAAILSTGCNDDPTGPTSGSLRISASTSGDDLDPDGFMVTIDGAQSLTLVRDTVLIIPNLSRGNHTLRLDGLAANCGVSGQNPRTVTVVAGDTVDASFTVGCSLRTGSLRVTTVTLGSEFDSDGYSVSVDGGPLQPIGVNAVVTITGIREGGRSVSLVGEDGNCAVAQPNPRTVTVPYSGIADVAFAIQCVVSGTLRITTTTSGTDLDQNGYRVSVEGESFDTLATVTANETVTISKLAPGDYRVTLRGVAANCDRTGPDVREAAVAAGSTTPVVFDVLCAPLTKLAFVSERDGNAEIYSINSNGTGAARLTTNPGPDVEPAWSPDGRRIAFRSDRDGNPEIYVMKDDGSSPVRLTDHASADDRPTWSPDGAKIAFVGERDDNPEIYVISADGSSPVRLTNDPAYDLDPAWSPDGARIAFMRGACDYSGCNGNIYVMNRDGSGVTQLTSGNQDGQPAWSPDGARLAFSRVASCYYYDCERDLYVVNADGSDVRQLTSGSDSHSDPSWSPDARKIAFTSSRCLDYYCNTVESFIMFVREDGTDPLRFANGEGYQPSWRR